MRLYSLLFSSLLLLSACASGPAVTAADKPTCDNVDNLITHEQTKTRHTGVIGMDRRVPPDPVVMERLWHIKKGCQEQANAL